MSEIYFANKAILGILALIPGLVIFLYWGYWRKDRLLLKFASSEMISKLKPHIHWGIRIWKIVLFTLAMGFFIVALARPQWGIFFQQFEQQGRDLAIALDLSKSMLAEDVRPNRLQRAKVDVRDLLTALQGDRIALIGFAGKAEVRCPLTHDYNFFRWALDECYPGIVPLGGTCIGDAIRKAMEVLEDKRAGAKTIEPGWWENFVAWLVGDDRVASYANDKAILLITDGEDHDSAPLEAAALAQKQHIRIFTVGLGTPGRGMQIPIVDDQGQRTYQTDSSGQIVWSSLREDLLREIALKTEGVYLPVRDRQADLASIYQDYLHELASTTQRSQKRKRFRERFQIFLFVGLLLLLIESMLQEGARSAVARKAKIATVAFVVSMVTGCEPNDQTPSDLIAKGNELYRQQQYAAARKQYQEASVALPDHALLHYNKGNTFYREESWDKASEFYQKSRGLVSQLADEDAHLERIHFNLGCTLYRQGQNLMKRASTIKQIQEVVILLRQSLQEFRHALEIAPQNSETQHNIRVVKFALKNYLDALHRKQKQEQEKKNTALAMLTRIRIQQRLIMRQTRANILSKSDSADLQQPQQQLVDELQKFATKLEKEFSQSLAQAQQQQKQAQQSKQLVQQGQAMLKMAKGLIKQARESMNSAAQYLHRNKPEALDEQMVVWRSLNAIWQILATPDLMLQEDIQFQQTITQNLSKLTASKSPIWNWTGEDQEHAAYLTQLFQQKSKMLQQMAQKMAPQGKQKTPPANPQQQVDIQKLAQLAQQEQEKVIELVNNRKQAPAVTASKKALELLKKIAQQTGSKQKQKQQQQQRQQQQREKQEQQQQKQKQQRKKQKQLSKRQARQMMQKVRERMQKHRRDKQRYFSTSGVDKDW